MNKLTSKLGNWVFKIHAVQGPVIYLLALIHPLFLFVFNYKIFHTFDPFYIYTQACLLCKPAIELFYTFGRLSIWLLTIGVLAVLFRNSDNWLKKNWRKLHCFNYVVFFLISLHGYFIGSDFKVFPLNYFFYFSVVIILSTVVIKLFKNR